MINYFLKKNWTNILKRRLRFKKHIISWFKYMSYVVPSYLT